MADAGVSPPHPPELLVLGHPTIFQVFDKEFSSRFRILRSWESPLPLLQFVAAEAQQTQAAMCPGGFPVSAELIRSLPCLRVLVSTSVGVDHIDLAECYRRGIQVANGPEVFSEDVADLAVGLLLDVLWKISAGNRFVKNRLCPKQGPFPFGSKLGAKRVGILGLGSIGLKVAKRLEPFDCAISYCSMNQKSSVNYTFYSDIQKLAAASDILIICCALTNQTHHLINREVLLALGQEGVIINVARGAVIEEKQLVSCLQRGEIGGAGLDVFENEPHVPQELFELDNVVLSPHCAVYTEQSSRDMYELMCQNLDAFFLNKPLITKVFTDQNN